MCIQQNNNVFPYDIHESFILFYHIIHKHPNSLRLNPEMMNLFTKNQIFKIVKICKYFSYHTLHKQTQAPKFFLLTNSEFDKTTNKKTIYQNLALIYQKPRHTH